MIQREGGRGGVRKGRAGEETRDAYGPQSLKHLYGPLLKWFAEPYHGLGLAIC